MIGRDHGADLDHEHHRVADLDARVELDEAVDQRARDDVARGTARPPGARAERPAGSGLWRHGTHQWPPALRRSRARFSCSTLTPGSPENPSPRPCVYVGDQAVDLRRAAAGGRRRCGGPGCRRWRPRCRGRSPEAERVGGVDRDLGRGQAAGIVRRAVLERDVGLDVGRDRLLGRRVVGAEVGERGARRRCSAGTVADGRLWKYCGSGIGHRIAVLVDLGLPFLTTCIGEVLADDLRADELAVDLDLLAVGVARGTRPG